jgi:hypothetical protein
MHQFNRYVQINVTWIAFIRENEYTLMLGLISSDSVVGPSWSP